MALNKGIKLAQRDNLLLGLTTLGWKRAADEKSYLVLEHPNKPNRRLFLGVLGGLSVGQRYSNAETVNPAFRDYVIARAEKVQPL